MDMKSLGYQFQTSYSPGGQGPHLRIDALDKNGKEVGRLWFDETESFPEGDFVGPTTHKFDNPNVDVDPDHQRKGIATEMVSRLGNEFPGAVFRWHNFLSDEGLGLAEKLHAKEPFKHLLHPEDKVI